MRFNERLQAAAQLKFRPMEPSDAPLLDMQPSQQFELGIEHLRFTLEEGEDLATTGLAWTAHRGARIVATGGFRELFPGHAVVWAALSVDVGSDHLAITRFARWQVENAPYRRLEAIVDGDNPRALTWAMLVGLKAAHVLRGYGAEGRDHILFEKVKA